MILRFIFDYIETNLVAHLNTVQNELDNSATPLLILKVNKRFHYTIFFSAVLSVQFIFSELSQGLKYNLHYVFKAMLI